MATRSKARPALAQRIVDARTATGMNQWQFAHAAASSARTVSRWETGEAVPRPKDRARLLAAVSAAPAPVVEALARELGLPAPAPPAAAQPIARGPTPAQLRASLDAFLLAGAEQLDVSPRRLRGLLVDFVKELDRLSATTEAARTALAATAQAERPPARG